MDTLDDLWAAEGHIGRLQAQAQKCAETRQLGDLWELVEMAGEPFVRPSCQDEHENDCHDDGGCAGFHPWDA
jgi:hypothetical protein